MVLPKFCSTQLSKLRIEDNQLKVHICLIMESEVNDCEEDAYHRVTMDEEVFKEHVKMLDQMCVKTFHDIELYIALRISGSYNEMVKAGEKLLVINKSLFEILRKVDEVCWRGNYKQRNVQ